MRSTRQFVECLAVLSLVVCLTCNNWAAEPSAQDRGIQDSVVQTLAGGNLGDGATNAKNVPFYYLQGGIARDSGGNFYFTEGHRVIKLDTTGTLTVIAGVEGQGGYSGDGGPAKQALLDYPSQLATDPSDALYVVDAGNNRIRKIAGGIITSVVGCGVSNPGFVEDVNRLGVNARINGSNIVALAVNAGGDIFFADAYVSVIYKVAGATGLLSIVGGNGKWGFTKDGQPAAGNPINRLGGLALLGNGDVIFSEVGAIREIKAGNSVVLAGAEDGNGNVVARRPIFPDDGTHNALQTDAAGPALPTAGGLEAPAKIAVDGGNIIFYDSKTARFRLFTVGGTIKTVAGEISEPTSGIGFRGDGTLAATNTPQPGIIVRPGVSGVLHTFAASDDVSFYDLDLQQNVIIAGPSGIAHTIAAPGDVQVAAVGSAVANDFTKRNDDPRALIFNGSIVAAGGVVTGVDDGNELIRQFTVGGNVNTIAGAFSPNRYFNTGYVTPVISSPLTANGTQGASFVYETLATDDPNSFSASGLPAGLGIDAATGNISGTPTTNGVFKVTLNASNSNGTGPNSTLTLTIAPIAGSPTFTSASTASGTAGTAFSFTLVATGATTYGAFGLPFPLVINPATGVISGTPASFDEGFFNLTVFATNATGTTFGQLGLTIVKAATAPVINSPLTASGTQGTAITTYNIAATNSPTAYNAFGLPPGLAVNGATGAITGTPTAQGLFEVTIQASNATDFGQALLIFTIAAPAGVPAITSPSLASGVSGAPFFYQIVASNSPIGFTSSGLPGGLTLDPISGIISGYPFGTTLNVNITAFNAAGVGTATVFFRIEDFFPGTVGGGNFNFAEVFSDNAPVAAIGAPIYYPDKVAADASHNLYFSAYDYYNNQVIYKYDSTAKTVAVFAGPTFQNGMTPNPGDGNPAVAAGLQGQGTQIGSAGGSIFFADSAPGTSGVPTSNTVRKVDSTGVITTVAGIPFVSGADAPNADRTLYLADGSINPVVARTGQTATSVLFNSPTGVLGTNATDFWVADTGNMAVVQVAGGKVTKDINLDLHPGFLAFADATDLIAVDAVGSGTIRPVISAAATASGTQGVFFTFQFGATGNPTFSALGLPGGLSVNSSTGLISGTPTTNGVFNVTLRAVQGAQTGTAALLLTIAPPATFPAITSASTATGTFGVVLTPYTITASNSPTGFGLTGLPGGTGLTFNAVTGVLSGTPALADEGVHILTPSATNAAGTGFGRLTLTVNTGTAPIVTSSNSVQGVVGIPVSYQITATDTPTSFGSGGLPPGLSLSTTTGVISGIPTTAASTVVGVTATNGSGTSPALAVTFNFGPGGSLRRINLTTGAITQFGPGLTNIRGLATGTNGLFVATTNSVSLLNPSTGSVIYSVMIPGFYTGLPTGVLPISGLTVNGTTVYLATAGDEMVRQFTDNGATPPAPGAIVPVAGNFFNTMQTGGAPLNVGFEFASFTPMALLGSNLIVGDEGPDQLRQVVLGASLAAATVTDFAGIGPEKDQNSGDGGPATNAYLLGEVDAITVGPDGSVYFSENQFQSSYVISSVIRVVNPSGVISNYAGIPGYAGFGGNGNDKLSTIFNDIDGLAFNPVTGELYVDEDYSSIVRKIGTDGKVVLVAGMPCQFGYQGEGEQALLALFDSPRSCAFDGNGDFYLADPQNYCLRVIAKDGTTRTLCGRGGNSPLQQQQEALETYFDGPYAVTLDSGGQVYFIGTDGPSYADMIVRVANGFAISVVGNGQNGFNGDGLSGPNTAVNEPDGMCYDGLLQLAFCDTYNNRVRQVLNLAQTISLPPVAKIVATPSKQGVVPFVVTFDGTTSSDPAGNIVSYSWDFGDGTTAAGPIVQHTYLVANSYTVTLVVTNAAGQTGTANETVIAAQPLVFSNTNAKGSFKIGLPITASSGTTSSAFKVAKTTKTKPTGKDSFSLTINGVPNLLDCSGKTAVIMIGSYTKTATIPSKTVKANDKTVKLVIDPVKMQVSLSLKGVNLGPAFQQLGVQNANTIGLQTVLVPVAINVANGFLVIGDQFLFTYKAKYNSSAVGGFVQ